MARSAKGSRRAPAEKTSARRKKLPEYEARRDFRRTPEPAPGGTPAESQLFVVHKHDATRLHYDLRLAIDGALASWAVPKGPSLDPKEKRLAVETEDHPIEYGSFEGRIPDGEYGAGDSLLWDRGTWDTIPPGEAVKQRKKGHLHFELHGEKLRGSWHLVRTRGDAEKPQWILFKGKDEEAAPDRDLLAERPESVVSGRRVTRGPERKADLRKRWPPAEELLKKYLPPMLAAPSGSAPRPEKDWLYELKYDGFRAICALSGGRVAMASRRGLDLAERFDHLARALSRIVVGAAVVDAEIVVLDPRGAPSFELLQKGHDDEAVLYAFDLLYLDGEDLRRRPLEERQDLLASLFSNLPASLRVAERIDANAADALRIAEDRGFEGLIAKKRGSRYESTRSQCWRKLKVQGSQEVAVVGFTRTTTGADAIGALLLGVYEDGAFRYAGKVGAGFSNALRGELFERLQADRSARPTVVDPPRMRGATWVRPRLVAQVRFTEWTAEGRLRHPSFLGLREDKKPEECVREAKVEPAKVEARRPGARVEVKLTTPDRVYYPRDGITKEDVAAYYDAVAPALLAALADRPLALEHWPKGIDEPSWFQQNIGSEAPEWMRLLETPTRTSARMVRHLVVDRPEALRWCAQHAVLTLHMWSSRAERLAEPDWVVFDCDPAEGEGIEQAVEAAKALHTLLDALSLPSVPKTSGKRGLHVLVPLLPGHTHDDALSFALAIGRAVADVLPSVTLERSKEKRKGRLYLDCLQNGYGKTLVAPWSPRAVDGAPVSTPLEWSEVRRGLDPKRFHIRTLPERLKKKGDLFAPALQHGVRLPRFS